MKLQFDALGSPKDAAENVSRTIESYNRDDCLSALRPRGWLEDRRSEPEARTCQALPRPAARSTDPKEDLAAKLTEVEEVANRLTLALPPEEAEWTPDQQARWLMAQMLSWHRREDKSTWWEYFRLCELSDEELKQDKNALGGLVYEGQAGTRKRSIIHRYAFPIQDHNEEEQVPGCFDS